MSIEFEIFEGKSLSSLFEDIYKNSKTNKTHPVRCNENARRHVAPMRMFEPPSPPISMLMGTRGAKRLQ